MGTQNINDEGRKDIEIMKIIKAILSRGNNAEVKLKKDGEITVFEIKKKIIHQ